MHVVICRRVEGFPDIPYPPQPYLLTCPQVRKKTFEAEQIKLEIDDENLLVFEEFWLANVTWFSNQNSSLYCASYLGFHN
jgi:hypothetical protein